MKEGNSGMLLTLGIGAAALFFLMKGKKQTEPDDMTLPELKQINPDPAPAYTPAAKMAQKNDDQGNEENTEEEDDEGGTNEAGEELAPARSVPAPGGGYNNYKPPAGINAYAPAALPQTPSGIQPLPNGGMYIGNGKPRAGMPPPPAFNAKSPRFQSHQARKLFASGALQRARPVAMQRPLSTIISQVRNPAAISTPIPQTTIFPLKFGQRNSYVKEIQSRIGVANTGYFGAQTREALQKRFGTSEVSELLYKQIITGKPVAQRKTKPAIRRRGIVPGKGSLMLSKSIFKR